MTENERIGAEMRSIMKAVAPKEEKPQEEPQAEEPKKTAKKQKKAE